MVDDDVVQHLCDINHSFPGIGTQRTVDAAFIHANKLMELCEIHNDVVCALNYDEASWVSYSIRGDELVRIDRIAVSVRPAGIL